MNRKQKRIARNPSNRTVKKIRLIGAILIGMVLFAIFGLVGRQDARKELYSHTIEACEQGLASCPALIKESEANGVEVLSNNGMYWIEVK